MNILFGVSGGVAIYKSLNIIRMLIKEKHDVKVIMTEHAAEFIRPILFKTISNNDVYIEDFDYRFPLAHIKLADWADVFAIAPATANTIAKIANGIADNLLTSNILAFPGRKVIFPAMNVHMYENPATQSNLEKLCKMDGFEIVQPDEGPLACGYSAKGRLPSEEMVFGIINRHPAAPLKGKKYIVGAGGTVEEIDPVRYLSNFSSGKMGVELAKALYRMGAEVLLIAGNVTAHLPPYINHRRVGSTVDMLEAIRKELKNADGLFMAAAPADFRVKNPSTQKIKKSGALCVDLEENPDILRSLRSDFKDKIMVGFALETENYEKHALDKLKNKELDYIVLNPISPEFSPMGNDKNRVILFAKNGDSAAFPEIEDALISKRETADWLVSRILIEKRV